MSIHPHFISMAKISDCLATTIIHRPMYNLTSDDSSSDDDSEYEPPHPGNTNTSTVSQNDNNPILKKKKKKKKAVADDEIRFLCSYGGEIVVVEHGYSSYRGGENRLILVEGRCSFDEFLHRPSTNIFQGAPGRSFTLKYEIPDNNLDLLITIRTDEDFRNMIKEYGRVNRSRRDYTPLNLRLFIFPVEDPDQPIVINPAAATTTTAATATGGMATHFPWYNSTSDDSSDDDDSEQESSHPGNTNTNTSTVSQNNNNPISKEEKKKKKKAVVDEIRLLCSYGGEIMVDKHGYRSYCGGENCLILMERRCSFAEFLHRLSTNIFQLGPPDRSFTPKYQLRREDFELNCLITIRTDEDLRNMIKEFDHVDRCRHDYTALNLRLFLFPVEYPDQPIVINPPAAAAATATTTTTTTAASTTTAENIFFLFILFVVLIIHIWVPDHRFVMGDENNN